MGWAVMVLAILACTFASAVQAPPARALDKGLIEPRLEGAGADAAMRKELIQEMGTRLGARWTRLSV